jgi:regulatory protein
LLIFLPIEEFLGILVLMESPKQKKNFTVEAIYAKAEHYCAYQERSQQEVREKLFEWNLNATDTEDAIASLIAGNFLNEERFALAYATGKFNQKSWGRMKIKQGLKLKRVPDVLIKKALAAINGEKYYANLLALLEKKSALLAERNPLKRRYKLQQYAMGRGYEMDLVLEALKEAN